MVFVAVAAYLIPFAVAVLAHGKRQGRSWELAIELVAVFAVDVLGVLLLALALRLDWAVIASRVLWIAGGIVLARQRRLAWPRWLRLRAAGLMALGATLGAWASLQLSRKWILWDRRWHIPLVTSLEGQRAPFANIFEPGHYLHYHFSGDVHAAMLRALSLGHMSSSMALSLSHDVVFALWGVFVALLLLDRARPAFVYVLFAVLAVLFHGPVVEHNKTGFEFSAHMYQLFLCVGFRPHLSISGFLLMGLAGIACVRATCEWPSPRRLAALALPIVALMSVTDETSTAIVLVALGVAWLVDARLLGERWWQGLALLAAAGVVVGVTNVVFQGSLAPGGPVQHLEWVPARIADLRTGAHPLWTDEGKTSLAFDLFPFTTPAVAVLVHAVVTRSRRVLALAAMCAVTVVLSAVLGTKVRINGTEGVEAERFFIAVFFVVLVVAFWLMVTMPRWSIRTALVVLGPAASLFFAFWWFRAAAPQVLAGSEATHPILTMNLYEIDCNVVGPPRIGERPVLTYVDESAWYLYTSCRGIYEAGIADPPWPTKIRPAFETPQHLVEFEQLAPPDATVPAVCWNGDKNDRVCTQLRKSVDCVPNGEHYVTCPFSAADRQRLLAGGR